MRLIDADANVVAIRVAIKSMKQSDNSNWLDGYIDGLDAACNTIEASPTIEAEPVIHSRWVEDRDGDEYCENCSRYMPSREVTGDPSAINYCPNCGAKMDGGAENG